MKKNILLLFFLFSVSVSFSQNEVITILQKSLSAGVQIKNGTYDAHLRVKYLMDNDTIAIKGSCRFQRLGSDTLKGAKFELVSNDTRALYDGRNKTTIYAKDSFAIVHDKWKYKLRFAGSIYHLLSDYIVNNRSNLDEAVKNPEIKKQLMKDTTISGVYCFHISMHPNDDETSQNIYRHLYISKDNYLVLGEVLNLDAHNHHQFTELFLQNVKINSSIPDINYGADLIPKDFFIKKYIPDQLSKLLSSGTPAPPFSLTSLEEKKYSLQNLKGKIVVLYFWNTADQQSRVRLMPLQKIYDKYTDKGVEVLGMNVSDRDEEHLKKFLQTKKITFPQLMDAGITGEKYNVLELPVIYVIGKEGKIIEGFVPAAKENLEMKIENLILKNQ